MVAVFTPTSKKLHHEGHHTGTEKGNRGQHCERERTAQGRREAHRFGCVADLPRRRKQWRVVPFLEGS